MKLEFDPRDPNACASVLAMINGLHGTIPFALAFPADDDEQADEAVDAAEAFDAPAPEAVFPPVPAAAEPVEPAPAPPVPAASAATVASPVELDKSGLPWDGRIHAGKPNAKIKTKEGDWRKRRGVDDALVATVSAELRQAMAAGGAPAPVPTPPAAPVAATPEPAPAAAPTPAPPAPPPTPAAAGTELGGAAAIPAAEPVVPVAAEQVVPPAPAGPVASFADLMRKITGLQTAGKLTVAGTNEIAVSLGLTSVRDLIHRPDLVASFDALLPVDA